MTTALVVRAPTRLDFGGGWTDVPPYPEREGGAVCNIAITRHATASVRSAPTSTPSLAPSDNDALIRAAIKRSGLPSITASVSSDYPIGAGLGGSSAAGVALAGALALLRREPLTPHALALHSRQTEVEELGVAGGYQDHFAAAFGGALLLHFSSEVTVERLPLSPSLLEAIPRRGIVIYTGESRISGETITAVRDAWLGGIPRVVGALERMKALASDMATAIRASDLDALGAALAEHWEHQRALHRAITTPRIDAIAETCARSGALGMKALGASGGGCVLALAEDGREEELARALEPFGARVTYAIDVAGFDVIASLDDHHSQ